jgi:cytochrome c5
MRSLAKVVIFSLLAIGSFVLFTTVYIPPIQPSPPPVEEAIDVGAMTMEQFIAMGDRIFNGKGTCTLCHNAVVKRAPLFEASGDIPAIGVRATDRIKDGRYKGKAASAAEYIEESMREPSAYVVAGFGVTGTNDTVSPMPVITAGAIGLNEVEVKAVVAHLQNLSGTDVTVEIPKGKPAEDKKDAAAPEPAKTAEEVVDKLGCGACHKIAGAQGAIGPDLTHIGSKRKADYLRRAVLDPNADVAPGFPPGMMPQDFKDKMTAGELELLVNYLSSSR